MLDSKVAAYLARDGWVGIGLGNLYVSFKKLCLKWRLCGYRKKLSSVGSEWQILVSVILYFIQILYQYSERIHFAHRTVTVPQSVVFWRKWKGMVSHCATCLPVFILFCLRDFCNFFQVHISDKSKSYLNRWTCYCLGWIIKIHAVPYCDQHCTSMKHQIDWQTMKTDFLMRCSSSIVK